MKHQYMIGDAKDFEGAPDEALMLVIDNRKRKHFVERYPQPGDKYWGYLGGQGIWGVGIKHLDFTIVAQRKLITAWDGEGLPPVGTVCEYRKMTRGEPDEYRVGTVMYLSEYTIVIKPRDYKGEFIHHPVTCEFRPTRSEADKQRDEFTNSCIKFDNGFRNSTEFFNAIYDAIAEGKIPGVIVQQPVPPGFSYKLTCDCCRTIIVDPDEAIHHGCD